MIYLAIKQDYIKCVDSNDAGDGFIRVGKRTDEIECVMHEGILSTIEEVAILILAEKFGGFLWGEEKEYIVLEFEDSAKAAKYVARLGGIIDSEYDFSYVRNPIPKGTKILFSFVSIDPNSEHLMEEAELEDSEGV